MSPGKIVIAGGSGFLGQAVADHLSDLGYEIVILSRSASGSKYKNVQWDGKSQGAWSSELDGAEAVINFSGANIAKAWTPKYQQVLASSRIEPTDAIGKTISDSVNPPKLWINGSAIGYYGDSGDQSLSEASASGEGFMGELCVKWERAQEEWVTPKTRKIAIRTGVVLSPDGGALQQLSKITKAFLGGHVGSGEQYMSWIHLEDYCRIVEWMLKTDIHGPINATAPNPATNKEFMSELRKALGRPPIAPPAPEAVFKLACSVMGLEPTVILQGQRVFPIAAQANGFRFLYPDLDEALDNLLDDAPDAWRK
ncbi:MAG: TIGR01777 family oxidoreductase [Armatimonadetes bacterium]|nr:TIGR01777 family oxidoreductase [Armatimonadota bacterium]